MRFSMINKASEKALCSDYERTKVNALKNRMQKPSYFRLVYE